MLTLHFSIGGYTWDIGLFCIIITIVIINIRNA